MQYTRMLLLVIGFLVVGISKAEAYPAIGLQPELCGVQSVALSSCFVTPTAMASSFYVSNYRNYTCRVDSYDLSFFGVGIENWIYCWIETPAQYIGQLINNYAIKGSYSPAFSSPEILAYYSVSTTEGTTLGNDQTTPYIYLYNTPKSTVSVSLDSDLDIFTPAHAFTSPNTWLLDSNSAGDLSLAGKPVDHLFYRLAIDDIKLSRYGRNFSSQAELIAYLKDSDFLDKFGLSKTEATNSLKTIVEDIKAAKNSPYYYVTVLDEESVNDVSQLNITPTPDKLIRSYFVVYPTPVLVKTSGDFIFPVTETIGSEYTAKETGELFLTSDTYVNFK